MEINMIKRLIFDVDGTLITNIKFVEPATKTLKKLGIYSKVNLKHMKNIIIIIIQMIT